MDSLGSRLAAGGAEENLDTPPIPKACGHLFINSCFREQPRVTQRLSLLPLAVPSGVASWSRQALTHPGAAAGGISSQHRPCPAGSISSSWHVIQSPALPVQGFLCQCQLLLEVLWPRVPDPEPQQHLWARAVSALSSVTSSSLPGVSPEPAAFGAARR